jgi:hypothetical protein
MALSVRHGERAALGFMLAPKQAAASARAAEAGA